MLNCLLIGYGEIGKGFKEAYEKYHNFDAIDINIKYPRKYFNYDIMFVAIPFTENFVENVKSYQALYSPKATVILSTVEVGTSSKVDAVHVPIEGKHPYLAESIKKWQVFMGGKNNIAYKFFADANKIVYQLEKPEHTEFLKLQSTTNYGIMIEYARYVNDCCKQIDMDYNEVIAFNTAYNQLYKSMGMQNFQRYILTPPEGAKQGHCVTPNAKILAKQFPNVIAAIVAEVKL